MANIINTVSKFMFETAVGKMVGYSYLGSVALGGVVGFVNGIDDAFHFLKNRESVKLQKPLKKYEGIVDGIVVSGIYASNGCVTSLTSMVIVAFFPLSVPALLYFSEEKSRKE